MRALFVLVLSVAISCSPASSTDGGGVPGPDEDGGSSRDASVVLPDAGARDAGPGDAGALDAGTPVSCGGDVVIRTTAEWDAFVRAACTVVGGKLDISVPDLTTLTATGLVAVNGPLIINTNPLLERVDLPSLRTSETLALDRNLRLSALSAPALETTQLLSVSDNARLTSFDAPSLRLVERRVVGGHAMFTRNAMLSRLSLPALVSLGGELSFNNNAALVSLDLPSLAGAGSLAFSQNNQLARVELPALLTLTVTGTGQNYVTGLTVSAMSALTTFSAPRLATIALDLEIRSNSALTVLWLPALRTVGGGFNISFNQVLPQCAATGIRDGLATAPTRTSMSANFGTGGCVDAGVMMDAGTRDADSTGFDAGAEPPPFLAAPRFTTGVVTPGPALNVARTDPFVVPLLDGRVLVAGGRNSAGALVTNVELFVPFVDGGAAFADGGLLRRPYERGAATRLRDGRVLFAGGPGTDAEVYDPRDGSFRATGPMSVVRLAATSTLLPDGRVLVAGGAAGALVHPSAELFDPTLDGGGGFVATGSMLMPRAAAAAVLLPNGEVLVAGGVSTYPFAQASTETTERFSIDGGLGRFSQARPMLFPYAGHLATVMDDGTVLFVSDRAERYESSLDGGSTLLVLPFNTPRMNVMVRADGGLLLLSTREGAQLQRDGGWQRLPMMLSTDRDGSGVAPLSDGRVVVIGGDGTPGCGLATPSTDLIDFDRPLPANQVAAAPLPVERSGFGLVALHDGRALLAGGGLGPVASAGVAVFEPPPTASGAGQWTTLTPLSAAPISPSVALAGPGVLIVGEGVGHLYDPSGPGSTLSTTNHLLNRVFLSPVTLTDGRVLLVGGYAAIGESTRSLDVYDPRNQGSFQFAGDMSERRLSATALQLASGKVLIVGGGQEYSPLPDELFDPADGGLSIISGTDHRLATAQLLADGRVLILSRTSRCGGSTSAELLDPVSMSRVALPSPPVNAAVVVRMRDELLLLGSGSAAVFSPDAGTFTTVAGPPFEGFSAVRLRDGRVLAVKNEYINATSATESALFWQ